MFEEPSERPAERLIDPKVRAKEKTEEFCAHAEVAAVFEGPRKFDAEVHFGLEYSLARDIQRRIARLERSKHAGIPVLPPASVAEAVELLNLRRALGLSANDYHVHRRPGEIMVVRWLEGDQVETFHERMQAHFDVALNDYREEERQSHGWKQDAATQTYLTALDAIDLKAADRYPRGVIQKHKVFVLSTLTADEMNIHFLAEDVMGLPVADLVGAASAPPEQPTERDLAWFFKLFSLRGVEEGTEKICFFGYLQKSEETFDTA